MTTLDPTLLPALNAVLGAMERPAPRHYAANPAADESDYHALVLRMECERNQALREALELDEELAAVEAAEREMGGLSYDAWMELNCGANDDRR
jgi:hypothetical protein